jgi:hypothetical protein
MSNKTIYDSCYVNQRANSNGSIFDYYTDTSMFVNKNKCNDFTPPFISYIPIGTTSKNINLENELKGMTRSNSLCATAKYKPVDSNLVERIDTVVVNKENNDCTNDFKILPRGYINHLV